VIEIFLRRHTTKRRAIHRKDINELKQQALLFELAAGPADSQTDYHSGVDKDHGTTAKPP
jgi:hypothetical protein